MVACKQAPEVRLRARERRILRPPGIVVVATTETPGLRNLGPAEWNVLYLINI